MLRPADLAALERKPTGTPGSLRAIAEDQHQRLTLAMLAIFAIAAAVFGYAIDFGAGAMLAAGALLTFGAGTDALALLPWPYRALYIATAFLGVSLLALFITAASAYFTSRR